MKTENTIEALWKLWSVGVPASLLQQDGIKAQFGAAAAVIGHLNREHKDGAWSFQPVSVGGFEDRALCVDGYLVNKDGDAYAVDFSLESAGNPKGNKAASRWLVHLRRDWFEVRSDGIWILRPCCMKALVRAFLPALANGPVDWTPGIRDDARIAS